MGQLLGVWFALAIVLSIGSGAELSARTEHADGDVGSDVPDYFHAKVEDLSKSNQALIHKLSDPTLEANEHFTAAEALIKRSARNARTLWVTVDSMILQPDLKRYFGLPAAIKRLGNSLCANNQFPEIFAALLPSDSKGNLGQIIDAMDSTASCEIILRPGLEESLIKLLLHGNPSDSRIAAKFIQHLKAPENSKILAEALSRFESQKPRPKPENLKRIVEALAVTGVPGSSTPVILDALNTLVFSRDDGLRYAALHLITSMGKRAAPLAESLIELANEPDWAKEILPVLGAIASPEVFQKLASEMILEGDDGMALAAVQGVLTANANQPGKGPELEKLLGEVAALRGNSDGRLKPAVINEMEKRAIAGLAERVVADGYVPTRKDPKISDAVFSTVERSYALDPKAPDLHKLDQVKLRNALSVVPDEKIAPFVDKVSADLDPENLGRAAFMLGGIGPRAGKAVDRVVDFLTKPTAEKVGDGIVSVYQGYSLSEALRSIATPEQLKAATPKILNNLNAEDMISKTYAIQFAGGMGKNIDDASFSKIIDTVKTSRYSFGMNPVVESTFDALKQLKAAGHRASPAQVADLGHTLDGLQTKKTMTEPEVRQTYNVLSLIPYVGGDLKSLAPKIRPLVQRNELSWQEMDRVGDALASLGGQDRADMQIGLDRAKAVTDPKQHIAISHYLTHFPDSAKEWVSPLHDAIVKGDKLDGWQSGLSSHLYSPPSVSKAVFEDVLKRMQNAPDIETAHKAMERLLPHPHLAFKTQIPLELVEKLAAVSEKYKDAKSYEGRELASWPKEYVERFKSEIEINKGASPKQGE